MAKQSRENACPKSGFAPYLPVHLELWLWTALLTSTEGGNAFTDTPCPSSRNLSLIKLATRINYHRFRIWKLVIFEKYHIEDAVKLCNLITFFELKIILPA